MAIQTRRRKPKRKQRREDRLITFYARAWQFFDENQRLVYGMLVGLAVLVLAIAGYLYYQTRQQAAAQQALSQIVSAYEAGNYQQALDGTQNRKGLVGIVNDYGGTTSGNLARFYAADAYYNLEQYDQALNMLHGYEKSADLFGAGALAMEASIYENQGAFTKAGTHYLEAAELYGNEFVAPRYLISAGRAFETGGSYGRALEAYQQLKTTYPEANAAQTVERYIARARAQQN